MSNVVKSKPKTVDEWLDDVDYSFKDYQPSDAVLKYINFIQLASGDELENKTPLVHLKMCEELFAHKKNTAMLCHRGLAKTTIGAEFLILYIAAFGEMPNLGKVEFIVYVGDSIENGVKSLRKNVEYRYNNSEFLQNLIPNMSIKVDEEQEEGTVSGAGKKFTDVRFEFRNKRGDKLAVRLYGAKALSLDTVLYTDNGTTTIGECKVGDRIFGADGKLCTITKKSEVFYKPMYIIRLHDGRTLRVSEDHINSVVVKKRVKDKWIEERLDLTTKELLKLPLSSNGESLLYIENCKPLEYSKKDLLVNPYLVGSLRANNTLSTDTISCKYLQGNVEQRLELLKGMMDVSGSVSLDDGSLSFTTNVVSLADYVCKLVRSLGGTAKLTNSSTVLIELNEVVFTTQDKVSKQRFNKPNKVAIESIDDIELEPSQCIAVDNEEHQFIAGDYVRTHNTGVRGAKEFGRRPTLAIIDDIISDEDAKSDAVIRTIEDTVHKAVKFALLPGKSKIIWLGTPFNANDPLYKVVESGSYAVACYPVCEKFPCDETEFKGSWEDRFNYEYVLNAYNEAISIGKLDSFNQELMLRITSSEDRLVSDDNILWFDRQLVLQNRSSYNFYITTDLATSSKSSADYSVISVWAYSYNKDYMLVDGWCDKVEVSEFIEMLFRKVSIFNPLGVGLEVTGQQGGFISWVRQEMIRKNVFFNLLSENNNGKEGIRPSSDKFSRFKLFAPRFNQRKVWFAEQVKHTAWGEEFLREIGKVTKGGFKSKHDDVLDTISMLGSFEAYAPSSTYRLSQEDEMFLPKDSMNELRSTIF